MDNVKLEGKGTTDMMSVPELRVLKLRDKAIKDLKERRRAQNRCWKRLSRHLGSILNRSERKRTARPRSPKGELARLNADAFCARLPIASVGHLP